MPEVSVIVPVYNSQRYLRLCIESVVAQSFDDWELLLVDDGSTDNSNSICREYLGTCDKIKLIEKSNGGLSSARNAGIDNAHGKFLLFLDADDELYPHAVETLYNVAVGCHSKIAVGRMAYAAIKPDLKPGRMSTITTRDAVDMCADILYQKKNTDNSVCWKLFDRSLFDGIRFYNGWYEDLEIFHKLFIKAGRIAITDSTVYFYRKHSDSFINSWSDGRRDIVGVTKGIVDTLGKAHPCLLKAAKHREFSACFNLLIALLRHRPDDLPAINYCYSRIKECRTEILFNHRSRMKNRLGAAASLLGLKFLKKLT